MPEKKPLSIAHEAYDLVHGQRQKDYGDKLKNFDNTARLWSVILGVSVTAEQVTLCMVQVKIARLLTSMTHRDSRVDLIGYPLCLDSIIKEREALRRKELVRARHQRADAKRKNSYQRAKSKPRKA